MKKLDFMPMRIAAIIAALFVFCAALWAQGPELIGIGLSGSPSSYDTTVMNGRPIYVVGLCTMGPDTEFFGVCAGQYQSLVFVRYYPSLRPDTSSIGFNTVAVLPQGITHETAHDTTRFEFSLTLPASIPSATQSLQLQFGVIGMISSTGQLVYGATRTSHAPVSGIQPCLNPVDENHETFLRAEFDRVTEPPTLLRPLAGRRVPEVIEVQYRQPEDALPGSLKLTFSWTGGVPDTLGPHIVYFSDALAGPNKTVFLFGRDLLQSAGVDSISGGDSLVHNAVYELELSYQDFLGHPAASDSAQGVGFDIATDPPDFLEPAAGGVSEEESLRVRYSLPEKASTVHLTFTWTAGGQDLSSPHDLTLWEGGLDSGETSFRINGFDIGTSNPYVTENPAGEYDSLAYGSAYRVTFSYQDSVGNAAVQVVHNGFVFAVDTLTLPPVLYLPQRFTADNASFTLKFLLPEAPEMGSVWVHLTDLTIGRVNWRVLVLGTLAAEGTHTIVLNGDNLLASPFATELYSYGGDTSYNHLVDGRQYTVYMSYRDFVGHDSAYSNLADTVKYDNSTVTPTLSQPSGPVTFGNYNLPVNFTIAEIPLRGSLRLVLERMSGQEWDLYSPHYLYPSNDSTAGFRLISLNAINLASSSGIDSMSAGNVLIPNSIYTLTVEYQDTLLNPVASVSRAGLTYTTGAIIWARGANLPSSGIMAPGARDVPIFRVSLTSLRAMGVLRGMTFDILGTAIKEDFVTNSLKLWWSQDSTFLAAMDVLLDTVKFWGTSVAFTDFASMIDTIERSYFFTVSFDSLANTEHDFSVNVTSSASINAAGDPVQAAYWPLERGDLAVEVEVMDFEARADSLFGTLHLAWRVASERDNDGFNIWRSESPDTGFVKVGDYLEDPSLEGIGDHSDSYRYQWLDRSVESGRTYYYRLEIVSLDGGHSFFEQVASGAPLAPPADYVLLPNRPNPFNATTTIEYIVPRSSRVWLWIYDILGRRVRILEDGGVKNAATYRVEWDGRNDEGGLVTTGIYFCQLRGERGFQKTQKMLFLR
jgi:hypothetical protein